ncbi:MAG: sulfur carrier protein [Celeribacter sp.]|jgi:sulfur carrier protein
MKLQLNGAPIEVRDTMLAQVLLTQGFGGAKVATAVNGVFVPVSQRADHALAEGDSIEVLAPMQGG